MDLGLRQKVVLVTGGSGGIGSGLVRQFAAESARVVIHYHRNRESAEALSAELPEGLSTVIQGDLTKEEDVKNVFNQTLEKFGPVEILIANSGICPGYGKAFHEVSLELWNATLAGNLTSVFLCMREFFRGIQTHKIQEPAAVMIGSTAGLYGEASNSAYAASKAPMNAGLLLTLKNELARLAPRGRVNSICPSWTVSEMVESLLAKPEHVTKVLQTVALRKVGRPLDVAQTAVFLASTKAAGHITGQVVTLAGGMEGRLLYQPGEIDLTKI